MNESGQTQAINKKVRTAGVYALKIQTLQNNGVADCFYSGNKNYLFAEMKYIAKLPKRLGTLIKSMLSDLQTEWIGNRYTEGRAVCVIIGSEKGWCIQTDPNQWENPILQCELTLTRNEIVEWIVRQTQD